MHVFSVLTFVPTAAKLPEDLAKKVITQIGGDLGGLKIAELARFLHAHGILNESDFEALINSQRNEAGRRNILQGCLLQLHTQPSHCKLLPTNLYLACLDSFEEDPGLSTHHFFAVSTLRPKSRCIYNKKKWR